MSENQTYPSPFASVGGTRHWKIWAIAAAMIIVAAAGTWTAGQYRIGRLDALVNKYEQPVTDFALYASRARAQSLEADLLEGCKQAQIGTWLQTTDALEFIDPDSGNRIIVRLDPAKSHVELNGRELSVCVRDEIENRQFDIGSMTNTWAMVLLVLGMGLAAWSWFGWEAWRRRDHIAMPMRVAEPETVVTTDVPSAPDEPNKS